jgi:hypothetical protein
MRNGAGDSSAAAMNVTRKRRREPIFMRLFVPATYNSV